VTRAALRRRLDKINASTPEPDPWDHLRDPGTRLMYVMLTVPVDLLEAEAAVDADPRHDDIEAEAARRYPALAATMRELAAAIDADNRDELHEVPAPSPDAIGESRYVLNGPHLRIDYAYGRDNRRWIRPEDGGGVVYDPTTFEGAVAIVIDAWATRVHVLNMRITSLWSHSDTTPGMEWYLRRRGLLDDDGEGEP
jgi:hypothetical protein